MTGLLLLALLALTGCASRAAENPRPAGPLAVAEGRPDCGYDPGAIPRADSLRARIYACYAWAQSHVVVDDDTLDRLTVYGELARTESDPGRYELVPLGLAHALPLRPRAPNP